jgi:hypothetical protein
VSDQAEIQRVARKEYLRFRSVGPPVYIEREEEEWEQQKCIVLSRGRRLTVPLVGVQVRGRKIDPTKWGNEE